MIEIRDDRHMRSLTGLSQAQFEQLLPTFTLVYQETRQEMYEREVAAGTRQRQPGGGAKGKLPTPADKLFFVLYYYKTYPTFDVLGTHFDMARSKANENLHIFFAYDDNSVRVNNNSYEDINGLKAEARMYNFYMQQIFSKEAQADIRADESKKVIMIEPPKDAVTFLKLVLYDASGKEISSNFYWLSGKGDENADFTSLSRLPEVKINYTASALQKESGKYTMTVDFENTTSTLAFFVNPKILKKSSKLMVLPVFWSDNYFSLLPKEKKQVKVEFTEKDLAGDTPILVIDGWNIKHEETEVK